MRLLALDAATENCSVALLVQGRLVERVVESGKPHAGQLLGMVSEVLAEGGIALADLDGIAASIGPGAFTGVRVSVAVAQGLAFGAGLKVIAISTLEALALRVLEDRAAGTPDNAIACLDARMQEVYWGCFAADVVRGVIATSVARVSAPESVAVPAARHAGIGRGFAAYPLLGHALNIEVPPGGEVWLPRAREFVRLGALRLAGGEFLDPAALQPLYLRDKVAETEQERAARAKSNDAKLS